MTKHSAPAPPSPALALQVLARRIRSLREKRGLTQEELAARCGISVSFASLLERGERSPSYETLLLVAAALHVPVSELLREEKGEPDEARRLMEFIVDRGLSPAQLRQLLAVAEVMFGEEAAVDETASAPVAARCSEPECGRPLLAKGLCAAHYHRLRRAKRGSPSA